MLRLYSLSLEQRLALYDVAQTLRSVYGLGHKRTAHELDISESVTAAWFLHGKKPKAVQRRYDLTLEHSAELDYVTATLYADGTLKSNLSNTSATGKKYYYRNLHLLRVKDRDFAQNFANDSAKLLGRKPLPITFLPNDGNRWRVQFACKTLAEYIDSRAWLKVPLSIDFLLGLFDAEGSVSIATDRKNSSVVVTNTDLDLLKAIKKSLIELNITTTIIPIKDTELTRNTCYNLSIIRKPSILEFAKHVGFRMQRKQDKLHYLVRWIHDYGQPDQWL